MKVLVVGSGGREHVLVWKIKKSPLVEAVYCAPGNGGISQLADCVNIEATDIDGLVKFAKKEKIDFVVVGPELPLSNGLVDAFEKVKIKAFGPNKLAAQLESSKVFSKAFMHKYNIPTAPFRVFEDYDQARNYLLHARFPLVIKAEGLAAGKGVIVCDKQEDGLEALSQIMKDKVFSDAGRRVVIEAFIKGEEVSILAISDGENYVILDSSQDHKRIFDDDLGPNTGGMGAYSPAPIIDKDMMKKIDARVIAPTIKGMKKEGVPFKGVLYAGLMMTRQGPLVLEYNVRFGDPEAQAVLPRLKNDLMELMDASVEGRLNDVQLVWDKQACVCVVMSSGGYPGQYEKGKEITGLENFEDDLHTLVFHAGTVKDGGKYLTSGGRVLDVVSFGVDIPKAIDRVYQSVEKIKFDRCFFRRDIGAKSMVGLARRARVVGRR